MTRRLWLTGAVAAGLCPVMAGRAWGQDRTRIDAVVASIQRYDYLGDRDALRRVVTDLPDEVEAPWLASRLDYWRGFAYWRSAINGFNLTPWPTDLEADLERGREFFVRAGQRAPDFLDAGIGELGCTGLQMFLKRDEPAAITGSRSPGAELARRLAERAPGHPRLVWVLGPAMWAAPEARGGGPVRTIAAYHRALAALAQTPAPADPLEPRWGEAELLMSLAWSYLHLPIPDLAEARRCAEAALARIPYWSYVLHLLLPQIEAAERASAAKEAVRVG